MALRPRLAAGLPLSWTSRAPYMRPREGKDTSCEVAAILLVVVPVVRWLRSRQRGRPGDGVPSVLCAAHKAQRGVIPSRHYAEIGPGVSGRGSRTPATQNAHAHARGNLYVKGTKKGRARPERRCGTGRGRDHAAYPASSGQSYTGGRGGAHRPSGTSWGYGTSRGPSSRAATGRGVPRGTKKFIHRGSSPFGTFGLLQEVLQIPAPHAPLPADLQARHPPLAAPAPHRRPLHSEVCGHLLGAQEAFGGGRLPSGQPYASGSNPGPSRRRNTG